MKSIICATMLLAVSCGMAAAFALMWFEDTVAICEPILWVRILELIMALSFAAFGLYCMIDAARKIRDKQAIDD